MHDVPEKVAIVMTLLSVVTGVVIIVRSLLDHIRRWRTEKVQAEMYNRTLDKLGAGPEVLNYVQSEAGSKMFKSMQEAPGRPSQPYNRIMNAVQLGVALFVLGIGFLVLRTWMVDQAALDSLLVIGSMGIAAGLALIASGIVSWVMARHFGLINGHDSERS